MEKRLTTGEIAEKVFELAEKFNEYVFLNPSILDDIPEKALLVFLDVDDSAFNSANIALADSLPQIPGSTRIYIRMHKYPRMVEEVGWDADLLTELVAA